MSYCHYCIAAHDCIYIFGKVFRIGTVRYHWPTSAHVSQAFSIAHCTDSEDLPIFVLSKFIPFTHCMIYLNIRGLEG